MVENRNSIVLESFTKYCERHPKERFWQALRNWSGYRYILVSNLPPDIPDCTTTCPAQQADTFYWEGKKA